jgi:protein AbiQ
MKLYYVNSDYVQALYGADNRVMYNKQQGIGSRPYIGIVLLIDGHEYYAPLTSPKPKHMEMKSNIDFIKIAGGEYGLINLNNMIPVMTGQISPINITRLTGSPDSGDRKYGELLKNQTFWCNDNADAITSKASYLYETITSGKGNDKLKARCCDYKRLEAEMVKYIDEIECPVEFEPVKVPPEARRKSR